MKVSKTHTAVIKKIPVRVTPVAAAVAAACADPVAASIGVARVMRMMRVMIFP